MFKTIRTSVESKEIITRLTRKFDLKSENVIARIALAYSLENDGRLDLNDIKDSKGKEYSRKVLLGDYTFVYLGFFSKFYDRDVKDSKLRLHIKQHLDSGLNKLDQYNDIKDILYGNN